MKTLLKILAAVAGLLLLLIAGLTVFVKVKYPPEKLKALVNEQVKKHLHREMALEGISVGIVRGLALEEFKLSDSPDFSSGTFVASRRLEVRPFLLPLLKGQVLIKSVELISPEIHVVRFPDGTFNFSDLTGGSTPTAASGPGEAPEGKEAAAPAFLVNRLVLEDGALSFEDRSPEQMNLGIKDLDLSVKSFSLLAPFDIDLSCRLDGRVKEKPLSGTVALDGRVSLFQDGEAAITALAIDVLKTSLEVKGTVKNFADPQADLALKIKSFDPQSVAPFAALPAELADAQFSGEVSVKGGMKQADARGRLNVSVAGITTRLDLDATLHEPAGDLRFQTKIQFSGLTMEKSAFAPDVRLTGPLSGSLNAKGNLKAMTADIAIDGKEAALEYGALAKKEPGSLLQASIHADLTEPFENPSLQAQGRLERLILSSAAPLPAEVGLRGPVSLDFSAKGAMNDLSLTVDLQGNELELAYGDLFKKQSGTVLRLKAAAVLKDMKDVDLSSCDVSLGPLNARVRGRITDMTGEGALALSAELQGQRRSGGPTAPLDLSVQAPPFSVDPLSAMVPMLKDYKLSGKTGLDVTVKGPFASPKIQGSLSLRGLGAVPMEGLVFSALNGEASFTGNSAAVNELKGKFNGSELSVKAGLKDFSHPEITLEGELAELDAGKLLAVFSSTPTAGAAASSSAPSASGPASDPFLIAKAQGNFRVGTVTHPNYIGRQFKLTWNLADVGADMGRSNGAADFSAADGKVYNLPLASKINKLLKKDATDVTYSRMSAHFTIVQG
ncbi:MAG: AsmA family protein, partial [Elusimicrobia bacterium]|nr:AsmA family protein [Elusimicrobiota bacterium]